jgi:hypothetical protein
MFLLFFARFCGILKIIVQDKEQDLKKKKKTDFRDFLGNPAQLCYFRSGSTGYLSNQDLGQSVESNTYTECWQAILSWS